MSENTSVRETKLGSFFAIVVFATVLSQLPLFVRRGMSSSVSIAIWGVASIICFFYCGGIRIKNISIPINITIIVLFFVFVAGIFNDAFWKSSIPRTIVISMLILCVGNVLGPNITTYDLKRIMRSYAYATIVLAVDVYWEFFRGASLSRVYLYDEKNSTALLLFTGVIILLSELGGIKKGGSVIRTGLYLFFCFILLYCTIIMQCRAVFVSFAVVLVFFIISSRAHWRYKALFILVISVVALYYLTHGQDFDLFMEKYIYAGRSHTDLDDLSSGRFQELVHFWTDIGDGFLFGNGRMKRESLVLTVLLEFGFLFGPLLLFLAVYPIFFGIMSLPKKSSFSLIYLSLAYGYVTNMFFEQLAPFGPGVKCFFLWFLLGVFASWKKGPHTRILCYG